MNPNYLEYKKQQVKYWSKISSFALALLPPLIRWQKDQNPFTKDFGWSQSSLKARILIVGICLIMLIISYYLNYYAISSVFWPEPLSVVNWVLLVPCGIGLFMELKGLMEK